MGDGDDDDDDDVLKAPAGGGAPPAARGVVELAGGAGDALRESPTGVLDLESVDRLAEGLIPMRARAAVAESVVESAEPVVVPEAVVVAALDDDGGGLGTDADPGTPVEFGTETVGTVVGRGALPILPADGSDPLLPLMVKEGLDARPPAAPPAVPPAAPGAGVEFMLSRPAKGSAT